MLQSGVCKKYVKKCVGKGWGDVVAVVWETGGRRMLLQCCVMGRGGGGGGDVVAVLWERGGGGGLCGQSSGGGKAQAAPGKLAVKVEPGVCGAVAICVCAVSCAPLSPHPFSSVFSPLTLARVPHCNTSYSLRPPTAGEEHLRPPSKPPWSGCEPEERPPQTHNRGRRGTAVDPIMPCTRAPHPPFPPSCQGWSGPVGGEHGTLQLPSVMSVTAQPRVDYPSNRRRLPLQPPSITPPTAVDYPPTVVGYPPTVVGYPPTVVGYPPTVGLGLTGASFVFASSGHPHSGNRAGLQKATCRQSCPADPM